MGASDSCGRQTAQDKKNSTLCLRFSCTTCRLVVTEGRRAFGGRCAFWFGIRAGLCL